MTTKGSAKNMHEPRISLIATFYNAAEYLERCVNSLLSQTHDDFEIILIDDGSTDDTYDRLVAFETDGRVRCFSKENGGAGSARNFGVEKSSGEFISFVDGDDFVSPYYLETLDEALKECGCALAIGNFAVVNDATSELIWSKVANHDLVAADEAILRLAYDELTESPWAKLAPRALYESLPFPERYYEDVAIAGMHYLAVGDVSYTDTPIYAYVMRAGSVVHKQSASITQLEDFVWAIDEFLRPIELQYPCYASAIAFRRLLECARAHNVAIRVHDDCDRARMIDRKLIRQMQAHVRMVSQDNRVPRKQSMRFAFLGFASPVYDIVFGIYEGFIKPLEIARELSCANNQD